MTTALSDVGATIQKRRCELDKLLDAAQYYEFLDEGLYNAICRAVAVLAASHLEGFIKDLVAALQADLNDYVASFEELPDALKREFCKRITMFDKVPADEVKERVQQLLDFFMKNPVKVDLLAFPYKESENKNSSQDFINKQLRRFGIPDAVETVSYGPLTAIFSNEREIEAKLVNDLTTFLGTLEQFPYAALPSDYQFPTLGRAAKGRSTLWGTYIEELLTRRHRVAHGDTLDNEATWESLKVDVTKLTVFMYGLTFHSAASVAKQGSIT